MVGWDGMGWDVVMLDNGVCGGVDLVAWDGLRREAGFGRDGRVNRVGGLGGMEGGRLVVAGVFAFALACVSASAFT